MIEKLNEENAVKRKQFVKALEEAKEKAVVDAEKAVGADAVEALPATIEARDHAKEQYEAALAQLAIIQDLVNKTEAKVEKTEENLKNVVVATTGADMNKIPDEIKEIVLPIQEEYLNKEVQLQLQEPVL